MLWYYKGFVKYDPRHASAQCYSMHLCLQFLFYTNYSAFIIHQLLFNIIYPAPHLVISAYQFIGLSTIVLLLIKLLCALISLYRLPQSPNALYNDAMPIFLVYNV